MADQTAVETRNGAREAPATEIARSLSDCAHDVVNLAELQTRLLKLDMQESVRQTVAPAGLLAIGLGLLVGSFPLLLMSIAFALVNGAAWPEWAAFLLATVLGLLGGGGLCAGAWWLFRNSVTGLERSRKELTENIQWLKDTLSSSGRMRHRRQC